MRDRLDVSIPQLVLAVLAASVLVGLLVGASTSSAAFDVYNDDWEGTTELRSMATRTGATVAVAHDSDVYGRVPANRTVAFVLGPTSTYAPRQLVRMREFVRSGGTLVVAGERREETNQLLRSLGAAARIDGRLLRDVGTNYRSDAMPVATGVANHSLVRGVESLTLNYGTAVRPHGATVLVNTSESAFLDANRSGTIDGDERFGSRPVVTVERVGSGRIVTVADPSVFINAMLERPDNRRFTRALLSGRDRLLLDYIHTRPLPPLRLAVFVIRDSAVLQFGIGALSVGALLVWVRRPGVVSAVVGAARRRWRGVSSSRDGRALARPADSTAALAARLERRHPDWDRERIERVVSAVERRRNR